MSSPGNPPMAHSNHKVYLACVTVPATPARRFTDGIGIGVLTRLFHRDLIDEILAETRKHQEKKSRTRLLPSRVVIYFVLAMCLFTGDPYEEVLRQLVNGL